MNIDEEIEKYLTEKFGSIYGNQSVLEGIRYGYELAQSKVKENELLHSVSVSFLYEFVNEFTDTKISKEAIKETLAKLNER